MATGPHASPPPIQSTAMSDKEQSTTMERILHEITAVSRRIEGVDASISSLTLETKSMRSDFAGFQSRVTGLEHRMESLETQIATSRDRDQYLLYLRSKFTDLEDRSRRDNIRLLGIPENEEGDMDPDLLEEWKTQTAECSMKLMGTLITQAKRRMDEQINKIEQLTKELEKIANQQNVSNQLAKMEERIKNKEEEIKSRKAHKFNRDKLDYEHRRIYTFARKYDILRTKYVPKSGAEDAIHQTSTDDSSEIGSSADEAPHNKLDFQGEMRLMQLATPPSGLNRRRGRGVRRRGGEEEEATSTRNKIEYSSSDQFEPPQHCC
ncbi:hypothetical protein NDU88_000765 [Pleurodeles waltl]|uniref:Uncharacterized protein n=1 Tax=Pleurodeles waltl TaxID=8319 RepID=A0AAV7UQW4_PLEWA|nr:hypothetical protein NDU88_000765 [Pleurodeles waltl]